MKHTKMRPIGLLSLLVALVMVAAACGDSGTTTTAATAGTDTTAAPTTAAPTTTAAVEEMALISDECPIPEPAEAVEIDLMGWEFPVTAQIAQELEECETDNLSFNIQFLGTDEANDAISLDMATEDPVYEIVATTDGRIGERYELGNGYVDLTPFIEKYRDEFDLDDIPDSYWEGGTIDGEILGVPLFSNTLHFFYNTDILAEYSITPPDNFDEVVAACAVLKDAGFDDPFNMNLSANWSWVIEFNSVIKSIGGKVINDDNTPGWDTPEGLAAVNAILALNDACMSDAGRAFGIDDAEAALRAGELTAMMSNRKSADYLHLLDAIKLLLHVGNNCGTGFFDRLHYPDFHLLQLNT